MSAAVIPHRFATVSIDSAKPHPRNPRRNDVGEIERSIHRNDFYGVIVVQESTGYILAGNHRWRAAKQAGLTSLPMQFVECDDATAERILAADNRLSDQGGYDDEQLAELLTSIHSNGGFEGTGYDQADFEDIVKRAGDTAIASGTEPTAEKNTAPRMEGVEYRIVIACEGEQHQAELLERLEAEGLKCQPLMS